MRDEKILEIIAAEKIIGRSKLDITTSWHAVPGWGRRLTLVTHQPRHDVQPIMAMQHGGAVTISVLPRIYAQLLAARQEVLTMPRDFPAMAHAAQPLRSATMRAAMCRPLRYDVTLRLRNQ
jgi:hypothetical protein